jgi:MFS family permease
MSDGTAAIHEPDAAAQPSGMSARAMGVVFAATFGCFLSVTPTIVAVLGVFLKPIAAEFGWPRTEVAGALVVAALGNAIAYPFAGRLADRIGPRRVILLGNLLLGISILLISQVPAQPLVYYLAFIFAGAVGALPSTMVIAKLIAEWFDRTRGFWMGFCGGVGNATGAILFPSLAAVLLSTYGWRSGFLGVGIIVLILGFPVLFFLLRESPVRLQRRAAAEPAILEGMTFREAMRTARFWWIFSIMPLGAGCMTAMFSTIVSILTDRGQSLTTAVMVINAFALSTLVVEPAIGWLVDRTKSPKIVAPMFFMAACGLWLLLHAESEPLLLLAGLMIGFGAGVDYCVLPYLLSRYFGLKELGAISGIAYSGTLLFGALAPLFLNSVFDLSGSYDAAVYTIAGILLYSSLAILTFGPYKFAVHRHATEAG